MSTPRPLPILDFRRIVQQHDAATGMRSGFPSDEDRARFHHVVELVGFCRDRLGHDRFCAAYTAIRELAVRVAPHTFVVEPVRDVRQVVVGYRFGFEQAAAANVFRAQATSTFALKL